MAIVTIDDVKAVGQIDYDDHDTQLQSLLEGAQDFVEQYCCIRLSSEEHVDERMDGGHRQLWPENLPVTAVSSVKDSWTDDEEVDADDYFFTDTRIMAVEEGVWPEGELRWKVTYTAGYTDTTAPKGLRSVLIGLTLLAYDNPTGRASKGGTGNEGVDWRALAEKNDLLTQMDHYSLRRYVE